MYILRLCLLFIEKNGTNSVKEALGSNDAPLPVKVPVYSPLTSITKSKSI